MALGTVFFWVVVVWWGMALSYTLLNLAFVPKLGPPPPAGEELPSLSVVIPARNEAAALEAAVSSHCGQDYPGLQVVVCDDNSTDVTPAILEKLRARHPNLVVIRGDEPPPGWLGKPNAMRRAYAAATGEMVLFVDADVRYAPGVHRRAVWELVRGSHDMVLLLSTLEGRGLEPLVLSFLDAFAVYAIPTFLVNAPRFRGFAFGAGSGNLVRREALEAIGGLEAIRAQVVDDVALGKAIKTLRGRFRLVVAFGEVRVRMYPGFFAAVEGFTKNLYSAFRRNALLAGLGFFGDWAVHVAPLLGLALARALPGAAHLLLPASLSVAAALLCNGAMCLWTGQPLWIAPLYAARTPIWTWIALRSLWRYHTRGIVWRGRTYPKGC